jgi:CHRD domain
MTRYGTTLRMTLVACVATAALAGCGMMSKSNTASFSGAMNAASEVPPNMTRGSGLAEAWLNKDTNVLKYKITFDGLSGPATAAHFHGPASAGSNAAVVVADQPDRGTGDPDAGPGGRPDGGQVVCQRAHRGEPGRGNSGTDAAENVASGWKHERLAWCPMTRCEIPEK